MPTIPFSPWYESESLPIGDMELVNFYGKVPETLTITNKWLIQTPGLTEAATAGTNEFGRGFILFNGVPYSVNGNNMYRLDRTLDAFGIPSYAAVKVNGGTTIPGSGRVIMADNGAKGGQIQLIIPDQTNQFNSYTFTTGGGLVQVSDGDFDGPVSSLIFVDGYFLFTKKNANKFFISNLRDGTAYTATDFADAEVDTDSIEAPFNLKGEVVIVGTDTFEPFQNVGGSGFPFARAEGGVQLKGTVSPFTLVELNGDMVWLGSGENEQPAIWRSGGGVPIKISTDAIDNKLRMYSDTDISNAFAVKYGESGSSFVAITIPNNATFVFDEASKEWHQRESISNNLPVEWRVSHIIKGYGELLVLDSLSNKIGIIDKEVYSEYGEAFRGRFTLPPIDNGGLPFSTDAFELVGETGNGLDDDIEPEVLLSWSDNGSRSFGDSISEGFGKIGEYETRAIWTQLGQAQRQRQFRVNVSGAYKWAFSKVEAVIE